ncbi:MAG: hypothetical protein Q9191_004069 [Dirinaria sp. TL-2023a]
MNLPTEDQVEAASKLLKSLDLTQMLREAASSAAGNPAPVLDSSNSHAVGATFCQSEQNDGTIQTEPMVGVAASEISPKPLVVQLKGLVSMHNPSKTSTLYTAPVDPTHRLQAFGEALRDAFIVADLLLPDKRPLLMHATIVNTLYARKVKGRHKGSGHGRRNRNAEKVDATALLEEFAAYEWAADVCIERVSICEMGAKKEIVDGAVVNEQYTEIASAPMPSLP